MSKNGIVIICIKTNLIAQNDSHIDFNVIATAKAKMEIFCLQVLTSIGTLIKIRIRPHAGYEEVMNIDIIMAPKDYEAIKGLCGTFDSNMGNDFHDRNGNPLQDRRQFIQTWKFVHFH